MEKQTDKYSRWTFTFLYCLARWKSLIKICSQRKESGVVDEKSSNEGTLSRSWMIDDTLNRRFFEKEELFSIIDSLFSSTYLDCNRWNVIDRSVTDRVWPKVLEDNWSFFSWAKSRTRLNEQFVKENILVHFQKGEETIRRNWKFFFKNASSLSNSFDAFFCLSDR